MWLSYSQLSCLECVDIIFFIKHVKDTGATIVCPYDLVFWLYRFYIYENPEFSSNVTNTFKVETPSEPVEIQPSH